MDIDTTTVSVDTTSGPAAAYVATPAGGAGPGVLVLHAWWGLNDDFRSWCDALAHEGFTALAPDLRDGRVADTIEEADAMRADFGVERLRPIVEAAKADLLSRSTTETLGIIGASMGAAWAFDSAESDPDRVAAVVAYYGITEAEWSSMGARVLHHFGDRDRLDPLDDAETMQKAMVEAGVDATLEVYAGADHWFAESLRPEYDAEAARLAWQRTVGFLRGLD